ncbi:MAG: hypothetical protein ACRDQ5_27875, partial [Sciscionella sp.]
WWVDHPKEPINPGRWSCGAQMIDQLRDELAERLNGPNPQQVCDDIRRHWWKLVLETAIDPAAQLDATAAAAGVEQGDRRTRRETIAYVVDALRQIPPASRGELTWRALFSYSKPTLDELSLFLRELPPGGLTGRLADEAARALDGAIGPRPSAKALDALGLLMGHGGIAGRSRLADFAKQDDALTRWLASVSAEQPSRPAVLRPVTEPVLAARTHDVIDALLQGMTLAEATAVVDRGSDDLPALLFRELPRMWSGPKGTGAEGTGAEGTVPRAETAVALAFLTAHADSCPESLFMQFEKQLRRWLKSAEYQQVHRIGRLLRTVDQRSSEEWRQFADPKAGKTGQTERAKRTRSSTKDTPREKGTSWPFGRRSGGK